MHRFRRHDLVIIAAEARRELAVDVLGGADRWPPEEVRRLVSEGYGGVFVPGIVRRQEGEERPYLAARKTRLCIGLSAPYRKGGERLRATAQVPISAVSDVQTPYQVARRALQAPCRGLPVFEVMGAVLEQACRCGAVCGVFGSAALELFCSLPMCHEASDLDVIVRYGSEESARELYRKLRLLEHGSDVRIDAELELSDGSAVKLAEFFSGSSRVLCKGCNGVRLLKRDEAAAMNWSSLFESGKEASWK